MPPDLASPAYRFLAQDEFFILVYVVPSVTVGAKFRLLYDDGTSDLVTCPETAVTRTANPNIITGDLRAKKPGVVIAAWAYQAAGTSVVVDGTAWGAFYIAQGQTLAGAAIRSCIGQGYIGGENGPTLGLFQTFDRWYAYVIQGTVAEDATAGTHICSLTVSPGAGNEMQVLYGMIKVGNTATTQAPYARITDGTNVLRWLVNDFNLSTGTSASAEYMLPSPVSTLLGGSVPYQTSQPLYISGTMTLVLAVQTTAVSVTQTFAVVLRVRGISNAMGVPGTVTLADTVGVPTTTLNTNGVF